MPITIKELLASDTISQATDKINFNFDQLLLNGGGPEGPIGPLGPPGPVGGRGLRGTQWFEDPTATPGTDPNTLIFLDLLEGDSYLQSDGTVWEYNGTVWVATVINLTGPQGPAGFSAGFQYFGQISLLSGQNTIYPSPMPGGTSAGANPSNQAVPAVMIGGIVSVTPSTSGITYTDAFQISNPMAQSIGSEITSLFVHQKDSSTRGITFHGGGAIASDKFEQSVIGNLSTIGLGIDDRLVFTVPKPATTPTQIDDLVGLEFITTKKGQRSYSGKAIEHYTGLDTTTPVLGGEYSDYRIVVGQSNASIPPKFSVNITTPGSSLQLGGSITLPGNPTIPITGGNFLLNTVNAQILTSGTNLIASTGVITIRSNNSNVDTNALGNISHVSANLINTTTSGISNNVTTTGNITHTIFNGAFSSQSSAAGNPANTPGNQVGWSYLYASNGIDLNANAPGSQIVLVSQGSMLLRTVTQDLNIESLGTNINVNAPAGRIDLIGLRVNIQATGTTSGSGGRIDLTTSFDDINITSARGVNILTGTTGATQTFDVGAGTIDMFSNLNTTINAGGSSSILSLLSGNNIVLTATSGTNGIIDINSKILDIDVNSNITIDSQTLQIGLSGGNLITTIQSGGFLTLNANGAASILSISSSGSRPSLTAGNPIPNLPIEVDGEISPQNFTGGNSVVVTRQNPAITSGSFTYTSTFVSNCVMNWIKIGAIVHVNGIVEFNDTLDPGSFGSGYIPLPVVLNILNGTNINAFYGHGTAYVTNQSGGDGKMVAVEIQQGVGGGSNIFKNYWVVKHLPTGTQGITDVRVQQGGSIGSRWPKSNTNIAGVSNVINANANVRFSFSYRLDN
jgi:hypothetical protein